MTTQLVPWPGGDDASGEWFVDNTDPSLAWDRGSIAGRDVPGLMSISGDGLANKIDAKAAAGASGVTTTFKGRDAVKPEIVIRIFTAADWESYQQAIHPLIVQKVGQRFTPLTVSHPQLALFGITAIAVTNVSAKFEKGVMTITVKATQWMPAKSTGSQTPNKPKAVSIPKTVLDVRNDAYDAAYHKDHPNEAGPPPPPAPSYTGTGP